MTTIQISHALCGAACIAAGGAIGETADDCTEPEPAEIVGCAVDVEEVLVTGSYLKRQSREFASPLEVLDRERLDAIGAIDAKDLVRDMTFNAGSLGVSATNWAGDDSSHGNASVNLRNLGNGATLTLVNGRRTVNTTYDNSGGGYVDIQGLPPNIALERIEVVKDGASAQYGSDAVAGVVNFITRQDFQGLELQIDLGGDTETRQQRDLLVSALAGMRGDRGQLTVAASWLDRSGLSFADRFDRYGRSGLSSFGQPGRYVPQTPPAGGTPVASNYWWPAGGADPADFAGSLPDPECETAARDDGVMGTLGLHPDFPHICVYDYSSFFALVRPEEQGKLHSDGRWQLGPSATLYGSLSYSQQESSRGNSLYPDVRYVIVPAHHFGLQLDAARRGFEPVPYQAMQRILGGAVDTPAEDRPISTVSTSQRTNWRALLGVEADLDIRGTPWSLDAGVVSSRHQLRQHWPVDTLTSRMNLAFAGLGGAACDAASGSPGSGNLGSGECFYYNSFQTSVYDPVTGARWNTADASPWAADPTLSVAQAARKYRNPPELLRWLQGAYATAAQVEQTVFDLVLTGTPFTLGNGELGVALGAQYRADETDVDYDDEANAFNFTFLTGDRDWRNRLRTWSVFAEALAPVTERLEATLAGRYASFETLDADSFDPKLALLLQATPALTVRASLGRSFRVGSLLQTGGSRTIFRNSSDPFSNAPALAYRASAATGNPTLAPERSRAFNVGLSWNPLGVLNGLSLVLDYYDYVYDDLVVREAHQELIDRDNASRCPNGVNGDAAAGPLCGAWDADGDGAVTVYSIGPGLPDKVIRRADGYLVRTEASYLNAPSLESSGVDLALAWSWGGEAGRFRAFANVSRTLSYDIILADGARIEGAGSRNAGNSIGRPMPKVRADVGLHWQRGDHAATLTVRTIDEYRDDTSQSAFLGAYIGYAEIIERMTTVDAQYRIELPAPPFASGASELTIGAVNLLNQSPPLVNVDGAYDYYTHDPRGRMLSLRWRLRLGSG